MMLRHSLRLALAGSVATVLLAGCADPKVPVYEVSETVVPAAAPIFCYRTLARSDCYDRPQPGPPNRLIGREPIVVLP